MLSSFSRADEKEIRKDTFATINALHTNANSTGNVRNTINFPSRQPVFVSVSEGIMAISCSAQQDNEHPEIRPQRRALLLLHVTMQIPGETLDKEDIASVS
jgi:hypothetical protein